MVYYIFICFADGALGAEQEEKSKSKKSKKKKKGGYNRLQQCWLPPSDIAGKEIVMINWMFTNEITRKV